MAKIYDFPGDQKEDCLTNKAARLIVEGLSNALDMYNEADGEDECNHEYVSYVGLSVVAGAFLRDYGSDQMLTIINEVLAKAKEDDA